VLDGTGARTSRISAKNPSRTAAGSAAAPAGTRQPDQWNIEPARTGQKVQRAGAVAAGAGRARHRRLLTGLAASFAVAFGPPRRVRETRAEPAQLQVTAVTSER
jgi:hypothetical protein